MNRSKILSILIVSLAASTLLSGPLQAQAGGKDAEAEARLALTSRVWTVRIAYGQNANEKAPSDFDTDDITIGFTQSGGNLIARVNRGHGFEGIGDPVTMSSGGAHGLFDLRFGHVIGNVGSRVNCKRSFVGRHPEFRLTFDPSRSELFGTVWIMKPDQGPPRPCASVLQLPTLRKSAI